MEQKPVLTFDDTIAPGDWPEWIQNFAHVGAWVFEPETGKNWWSSGVFKLFEIDPAHCGSTPDLTDHFLDGADRQISKAIAEAISTGTPWTIKARFRSSKGNLRWVISQGERRTRSGKSILTGCFQDITDLEGLYDATKQHQQFLDKILDSLPHMVFVKEAEHLRFVHFNKAGEDLLGTSRENLIGRNDYDFFPRQQADHFVEKDRSVLKSGKMVTIAEEPIDTPAGRRILRTKKAGLYDRDGKAAYLLGISEDITDLKAQQELLEKQRETIIQNSRLSALGMLAGGVAHEINNPLSVLRLVSDQLALLLKDQIGSSDKVKNLVERHQATVDRIAAIVRGLRDIARDGRRDAFTPAQVNTIIADTLVFCNEKFRQHGIRLEVCYAPQDATINCQQVRISQVLINLLANAFDAVRNTSNPVISINCEASGGKVRITVADNGPGVSPENRDSIMLPFFTTKPVGSGTGLGLSISRGIVEEHGGILQLQDRVQGAAFEIILPAAGQSEAG